MSTQKYFILKETSVLQSKGCKFRQVHDACGLLDRADFYCVPSAVTYGHGFCRIMPLTTLFSSVVLS